jgi:hypothetical protein
VAFLQRLTHGVTDKEPFIGLRVTILKSVGETIQLTLKKRPRILRNWEAPRTLDFSFSSDQRIARGLSMLSALVKCFDNLESFIFKSMFSIVRPKHFRFVSAGRTNREHDDKLPLIIANTPGSADSFINSVGSAS